MFASDEKLEKLTQFFDGSKHEKNGYKTLLKYINEAEVLANKDLSSFNSEDIQGLFTRVRTQYTRKTDIHCKRLYDLLDLYAKHSRMSGVELKIESALKEIERSTGNKKAKHFIRDEQFQRAFAELDEARDRFIIYGLYNGAENSNNPTHLGGMLIDDIKDGIFYFRQRSDYLPYKPSDKLLQYAYDSFHQTETDKVGKGVCGDLIQDEYVIHTLKRANTLRQKPKDEHTPIKGTLRISRSCLVMNRILAFIDMNLGDPDITPRDIIVSGAFNDIKKDMKRHNMDLKTYLNSDYFTALQQKHTCLNPEFKTRRGIFLDADVILEEYKDVFNY